jgi:uncharacterized protein (TIGR03437 family)
MIRLSLLLIALPAAAQLTVVSSATFEERPLAPGSLATVFGSFGAVQAPAVRVLVNGVAAPVSHVSSGQINFRVPEEAPVGEVPIAVEVSGTRVGERRFDVRAVSPAVFVRDPADPARPAAVLNQDGSLNSESNRARPGDLIQIFATGHGATLAPGQLPSVFIGLMRTEVEFSGASPDLPGLWRINARVPAGLTADQLPMGIAYLGEDSNTASIWVGP